MNTLALYKGLWPKNVSKTAKYRVMRIDDEWKITVIFDLGNGLQFLAMENNNTDIVDKVNKVKRISALGGQEGGSFYINEYKHLIVPVKKDDSSHYYLVDKVETNFTFMFEGKQLTTRPIRLDGTPLIPGDLWEGPRPGIPYILAAGGNDIYYQTPALTDETPPSIRPNIKKKVFLTKVLENEAASKTIRLVSRFRGSQGGRFYVNEHKAIFTPVDKEDGNGLVYIYCGQIDLDFWFPEPSLT